MHRSSEYYIVDKTTAFFRSYLIELTTHQIKTQHPISLLPFCISVFFCWNAHPAVFAVLLFSVCSADPIWLKRQNALAARRLAARVHLRRKRGVPLGRRPRDGPGLALWQKSKHQKYAFLKPRKEGEAAPKGTFPEEMQREQTQKGHGQAPSDLLNVKPKQEKIYY